MCPYAIHFGIEIYRSSETDKQRLCQLRSLLENAIGEIKQRLYGILLGCSCSFLMQDYAEYYISSEFFLQCNSILNKFVQIDAHLSHRCFTYGVLVKLRNEISRAFQTLI